MKKCIVFGAGEYGGSCPAVTADDLLIAADGGYQKCLEYGLTPQIILGDFDSLGYIPENATLVLPEEKDVTDLDASVHYGLEQHCDCFELFGVFGGRIDHSLANLSLLARLSEQKIPATMFGNGYKAQAVTDGELKIEGQPGKTVSVFSFSESSTGVTLKGLKYPLNDFTLHNTFALGISNAFLTSTAAIRVRKGTLIAVYYYE